MKLVDRTLLDLLVAFRSPAPTPGGGSAAALGGAVGASLLAMIGSLSRHRAASEEEVDQLTTAARRCAAISDRLAACVDEDADAYDGVVAAYRLPKTGPHEQRERTARIQQALRQAIAVPLEVVHRCGEALGMAPIVAAFGNPNASSDVGVALELLLAGARGARLNVETNLGTVKDPDYVQDVRQELVRLDAACDRDAAAARSHLG